MEEPPDLAEERILGVLRGEFGIRVAGLRFLSVGNDPGSWAYRVERSEGPACFLKVRAGAGAMPGAAVPLHLRRLGVPLVLAPVPTRAGAPFAVTGGFALALFPMLDARPGVDVGLSPAQWRELGAAVARLHALAPTPELAGLVARERFRPSRRELLPRLTAAVAASPGDPPGAALAASWRANAEVIAELAARADRLGGELAATPTRPVLCHADLHTWNVLVGSDRQLWLVDWDEAVLAPRERDLMFVVGGIGHGLVRPEDTASFLRGYGPADPDPRLLGYYRCAWAVQDIAAYGQQVLLNPAAGPATRQAAADGFAELFAPGNIVDLATGSPGS